MEHRKQAPDTVERRYSPGIEIRQSEDGQAGLFGYAARFGDVYDMGWFTEEIHRSAFQNADLTDVRILLNHDPNQILGRTTAGTAEVGVDEIGLWYRVPSLPASPNGQNVRVALERGDINQSSWGFVLNYTKDKNPDEWTKRNGKDHRIIKDVKMIFDASPVTFPANPDTSAAKRSFEQFGTELPPESTSSTYEIGIRERRVRLLAIQSKL